MRYNPMIAIMLLVCSLVLAAVSLSLLVACEELER